MNKSTKNILRIVISIIYIAWGILSPLTAIKAIIDLNLGAILSATVGVLTLLAGIFGLIGIKKTKCRIFGIVIFVFSVISAVVAFSVSSVITAVLAWLFILCL